MKLDPNVYRNAAELIKTGKRPACCSAISMASPTWEQYYYTDPFARLFKPEFSGAYWWSAGYGYNAREARIFALLLMAEIVESENKPRKKKRP